MKKNGNPKRDAMREIELWRENAAHLAENGLYDPVLVGRIADAVEFAEAYDDGNIAVAKAISILDVIRETHKALNGNEHAYYTIPGDRRLLERAAHDRWRRVGRAHRVHHRLRRPGAGIQPRRQPRGGALRRRGVGLPHQRDRRLRQPAAVNDGRVVELVGEKGRILRTERHQRTDVGGVSSWEK